MFFLTSAGFTTVKSTKSSPQNLGCWICDAIDTCKLAANDQVGQERCIDPTYWPGIQYCDTFGALCDAGDIVPGEG